MANSTALYLVPQKDGTYFISQYSSSISGGATSANDRTSQVACNLMSKMDASVALRLKGHKIYGLDPAAPPPPYLLSEPSASSLDNEQIKIELERLPKTLDSDNVRSVTKNMIALIGNRGRDQEIRNLMIIKVFAWCNQLELWDDAYDYNEIFNSSDNSSLIIPIVEMLDKIERSDWYVAPHMIFVLQVLLHLEEDDVEFFKPVFKTIVDEGAEERTEYCEVVRFFTRITRGDQKRNLASLCQWVEEFFQENALVWVSSLCAAYWWEKSLDPQFAINFFEKFYNRIPTLTLGDLFEDSRFEIPNESYFRVFDEANRLLSFHKNHFRYFDIFINRVIKLLNRKKIDPSKVSKELLDCFIKNIDNGYEPSKETTALLPDFFNKLLLSKDFIIKRKVFGLFLRKYSKIFLTKNLPGEDFHIFYLKLMECIYLLESSLMYEFVDCIYMAGLEGRSKEDQLLLTAAVISYFEEKSIPHREFIESLSERTRWCNKKILLQPWLEFAERMGCVSELARPLYLDDLHGTTALSR